MIKPEEIFEPEWLDWFRKTPEERLASSNEAWKNYQALGGSLSPDADSESPFWSREEIQKFAEEHAAASERVRLSR